MKDALRTCIVLSLIVLTPASPLCLSAPAQQETSLATKLAQIELGKSTLDDVVRLFGEPAKFADDSRTYTRADLPKVYAAVYENIRFVIEDGAVRGMMIDSPAYRHESGVHVGATIAEVIKATGEPKAVVKGPPPAQQEPRPGVLYEGSPDSRGIYIRWDLGLIMFFKDGRVGQLRIEPQRGGKLKTLPHFDPKFQNSFQVDLRGADLSGLDLRDRVDDLAQAVFDTHTVWPLREKLPAGFDPQRILETGKNPGLGVRSLHKRGITGRGVAIAVVDNPLLDSHREYTSRVRLHDYVNAPKDGDPHFHGSSVVSLAAGRTIGVAPEAEIYYISSWAFTAGQLDFTPRARAFERILEVNRGLPADKKIRVIVMAFGWAPSQRGAAEMDAAAEKAQEAGMLVVTPNITQTHGSKLKFHGLGRTPLADPDSFESHGPGQFWASQFFAGGSTDRLLVPMDSRTTAGAGSDDEYFFSPQGGWSWAMPYIGGLYALAVQVDPKVTPERFWDVAMQTGRTVTLKRGDKSYPLGPIANPVALIAALERH